MEKPKVNENILKISSGGVCLPESLSLSHRYILRTEIDITDVTKKDNQDGTINLIFKGKQTGNIELLADGKKVIKAEAKKRVSQSIHGAVWHYHNEQGMTEDFEEYYNRTGKKIASYMPEIIKFLESKS